MQFILFLLLVFTIGCVMYGISAGVQGIQQGASWLANHSHDDNTNQLQSTKHSNTTDSNEQASNTAHGIEELQTLFALHQQGALTSQEFQEMKKHLLLSLRSKQHGH
ncbi:Uncharacterised protein [uncultured Comamonas sp.]|nr:Uncharacterised protein [uncultured Comamonas sp.]